MGNGPGLKTKTYEEILQNMTESVVASTGIDDIADGTAFAAILEAAAQSAANSFGRPNHIMMSPQNFGAFASAFGGGHGVIWHPEYTGTGWENKWRLTKRERKMAQLHVFLKKLRVLPDETVNAEIKETAVKRLKRARWARYQQAKKV